MKCGFCGKELSQSTSQRPDGRQDIIISQFLYDLCDHDPLPTKPGPEGLAFIKALIDLQARSIERLEFFFISKREALANQLKEFCEANRSFLLGCEKISRDFEQNFARLSKMKVEDSWKGVIKERLEDYFDKDLLVGWAKSCEIESGKLLRKLEYLEEGLGREIEGIFLKELVSIQQIAQPFRSKLKLHEITYKALENEIISEKRSDFIKEEESEGDSTEAKLESQGALYEIFRDLHQQAGDAIKQIAEVVFKTTKRTESSLSRNKYLVSNNVSELAVDSKILAIFENFDEVFLKCIEELKQRGKFRHIYRQILNILNDLTKTENERRTSFVLKFSSKIPSQIFPNIRKLAREINVEKFFEGIDEELPMQIQTIQRVENGLENIRSLLFGL